jgi:hypothetical protein
MAPDFLLSLSQVLEHGLNTNSYKFVLARALADDELPTGPVIPANWLAAKFLELYWPLATEFRVRQSTDPAREPIASKWAIRLATDLRVQPGQIFSSVRTAHEREVESLIHRLAARGGCLDEVVPRFNLVKGQSVAAPLFRPADDKRSLMMMPGAADWIAAYRLPMRQLANGAWVRFTEVFSAAPRLYQKLAGERASRKTLAGHRITLQQYGARCFYCGRHDAESYEVDHFLPWSFVFEDRLWNPCLGLWWPRRLQPDKEGWYSE